MCGEAHGEHRNERGETDDHRRSPPELAGDCERDQPRGRDGDHVARDEHESQAATAQPPSSLRRLEVGVAVAHDLLRVRRARSLPRREVVLS